MMQIIHAEKTGNMCAVEKRFARRAISSFVATIIVASIAAAIVGIGLLVVQTSQTQTANTPQSSDVTSHPQVTYPGGLPASGSGADVSLSGICDNPTNYYYCYYLPPNLLNGSAMENQSGWNVNLTGVCNDPNNYHYTYYC